MTATIIQFRPRVSYSDLDAFTQGYLDALFFTECHCDNPELEELGFLDIEQETLHSIIEECRDFQELNADALDHAYLRPGYGAEQAGHDYWLTRNGHGAGFWDRGLGRIGDKLTRAAKADGGRDAYRGDDGKLYLG